MVHFQGGDNSFKIVFLSFWGNNLLPWVDPFLGVDPFSKGNQCEGKQTSHKSRLPLKNGVLFPLTIRMEAEIIPDNTAGKWLNLYDLNRFPQH